MSKHGKTDMVRGVKHRAEKAKPARLDEDRKAKPLTTLVAHIPTDGRCVNASDWIDELRDQDPSKK